MGSELQARNRLQVACQSKRSVDGYLAVTKPGPASIIVGTGARLDKATNDHSGNRDIRVAV